MAPKKRKGKGKGKGKTVPETEEKQRQDQKEETQPQISPSAHEATVGYPEDAPETGKETRDEKASTSQQPETDSSEKSLHVTPEAPAAYLEVSSIRIPFAERPDHGTRGKKIGLFVNYFPLVLPSGNVYHYDVEIKLKRRDSKETASAVPESSGKRYRCLNTRTNRKVINTMVSKHREFQGCLPAYDGQKNLYTKTPLDAAPLTVTVEMPVIATGARLPEDPLPRGHIFEVSIKPVCKKETIDNAISLDTLHALYARKTNEVPQEAVMAVETILRNGPCLRYVPISRSFFGPDASYPLGGGKEIWFGYHQGLILAEWAPVVNINVTATTFRKSGPLIEYVCEILGCTGDELYSTPQLRDADIVQLNNKLKGVRIKVTHLLYEREYRVLKLTREAASKLKFTLETNEGKISRTVSNYFKEKYRKTLKYPQLPCLQVHPEQKKVYLPLEVCNIIPGQHHTKEKMTESQKSDMIRVASLPPRERFQKIQEVLRDEDFNNDPHNVEFGVRVSPKPLSLEGRVIDPPNVMYQNERRIMPKDGSWEMKPEKFFRGGDIDYWVMLSFVNERYCSRVDLQNFARLLGNVAQDCGTNLGSLDYIDIFREGNAGNVLRSVLGKFPAAKLAVIVLEGKTSPLYAEVKRVAEIELGRLTQCVRALNVKRLNPSVVSNLCQKINAKTGGINNSLAPGETPEIFNKPVIVISAYVSHPPPGSGMRPSIAAGVGSLDRYPLRYAVSIRAQTYRNYKNEIILDLKTMVVELLLAFHKSTRKKPEKIIFYRQGISEGQFDDVRNTELPAIREACKNLQADYEPAITFIIVQKKHHTLFIPRDPKDGIGKNGNVPPGTVVDRVATSRIHYEFFLCSHFGLHGTSRPGHYTVLYDDSKFTSDELQKLTYYLCHIYARCTKSISIPAPVKYAHLAAYRAAKYLITALDEGSSCSDTADSELGILLSRWAEISKIKPEMKNTMFFV